MDALGAVASVAEGLTTPLVLAADARERAQAWEPWLGAVVRLLDPVTTGSASGPAAGTVVGVKDVLAIAGVPRGGGAPHLVDSGPQAVHATAVRRLLDAGAAVVATLSLPPLAYGPITVGTRNPRAADRIAGGSSGGSAAALAAGIIHASLGTDTGGSVRIPAACCGVVGLKTTRGLVSLTGVQPLAWTLDTVGPMAGTVADAALILSVIAGHDRDDRYSVDIAPPPAGLRECDVTRLRIGIPRQVREARIDDDVRRVWYDTLDKLAAAGAEVTDLDLPGLTEANAANAHIVRAEAAAAYGKIVKANPDRCTPEVWERIQTGLRLEAVVVAEARHHGAALSSELRNVFQDIDVLMTPTLPCRIPRVGSRLIDVGGVQERVESVLTRFTNPWNLVGIPAGTVPAGHDIGDGPIGMQVIGRWFAEETVLSVMSEVERMSGGPWPTVETAPAGNPSTETR